VRPEVKHPDHYDPLWFGFVMVDRDGTERRPRYATDLFWNQHQREDV
jgi:hypothetical protein